MAGGTLAGSEHPLAGGAKFELNGDHSSSAVGLVDGAESLE